MNGPFQVAQANGTASSSTNGTPVRIYKLTKPLTDQAVMVNLGYDQKVKVDFSAIADEKITLVHVGEKLIVLFDNQSTVTVEPFFKSRADGLGGETRDEITVEMAPGRDISVQEFATLFPITTDTSVLPAEDRDGNSNANAQASGAYFSPFAVDPLAPVPLNQLAPQEELGNFVLELPTRGNVLPDQVGGNLIPDDNLRPDETPPPISVGDSTPTDTIPAAGGATTTVFEHGLPARGSEPAGSGEIADGNPTNNSDPSETVSGTIAFTSLDGVSVVSLGGHVLTGAPQTFADGTTGTLTASFTYDAATGAGVISYSYTLIDNTLVDPSSSSSFAVVVTDADGDSAPAGNLAISIVDDVPTAHADTDATAVGQFTAETGNVITAVGTTSPVSGVDVLGADGAVVSGVAAGTTNADLDNAATLNTPIQGAFGKLTLAADGSYSYTRDAGTAGGADDVFTYTVKDGDGDLSHTTLTISVGDSTPTDTIPAPGGATTTVFEHGLPARAAEPAGSGEIADGNPTNNSDPSETVSGTIAFTSPDGVSVVSLGGHVLTGAPQTFADGTTGTLTASFTYNAATDAGVISYSYTLIDNTLVDPSSSSSFAVVVTDADGDSAPAGNLVISIVDDVPTATLDSGNVNEGALLTVAASGVLANDVAGADGFTAGGGVVGVRAAGIDLTTDVTTGIGTNIAGLHGTLVLQANGGYTYQSTADNITAATTDVFVYTVKDGDGDLSTTTLTINLADVTVTASDTDALVNEAGLPVIGSAAASNSEIFNGSITPSGGTGPYSFALTSPATGIHGTLVLNAATGTYTYTLTSPFDTTPDSATTAAQTEQDKDSFSYTVTDAQGNTATGTILVDIVDDVPTATLDSGNVNEGALLTVAASGVLANDVAGADGFTAGGGVVGVRAAGIDLTTDVTTGVGTSIAGLHGTLVLQANGGYTYQSTADNITAATTDVFVYTVKDGDGDLSTTTLTINLADVTVTASDTDALVNEAGLPVIGSAAASNSEIFNGSITPSGGTGPYSFALTSPATGIHGTLVLNAATGTYTYTLTSPFDTTPDSATTAAQTEQDKDSFSYTVTDAQGNTATGTILVDIVDDVPTATLDSGNVNEGALLTVAASGVLANDVAGADGFTAGGGVVGVRAAGIDLTTDVTTGIGTNIAGLHGTLVLQANGGYTYQSTADNITAATTDVFVYTVKDGDGDLSTTTLTINLADVTVTASDTDALVNEAGLPVIGSAAASNSEIFNGSITPSGGTGPYSFALISPATGIHGTLVLNAATGTYTYTLTSPFDTTPDSATTAAQTEQDKDSFSYTVTDAQGNTATGTILVDIVDDVPTATLDSGNVNEGALLTVAASGVLANDVAGADGFTAGGGVVGVRAAGIDLTTDVTTGIGTNIAGLHGTLVLQANGGYTYQSTADNVTAATTDVFVYTVKDGDGDLSTTTLTINLADVTVTASDTDALVNEAGLPVIGSAAASNSEIFNGSITPSGGTGPYSFALTSPATGIHGTLVLNAATGTYTYTLTSPFDTTPDSATTAAQTEQDKDSFSYTVTDAQGNTATGTILVDIVDDVPTATLDSGNVNEGALLTVAASGVLANDVAGADGFTAGGGVVGVRAAGIDLTTDVTTGVGTSIAGLHGTLVLQANGGYTYQSTADNITAATTDVFVYTVKDGDGDLSTTTLTINLADVTVTASDTDALVNEAGLPVIGSAAASNSEIFNGSITPSGGTGPYSFALTSPATGIHGTLVLNAATGTYTYTLTSPFDTTPDSATTAAQTEQDKDSFSYTVTDAQGNTATGTILVDIVDDVPTATLDSGNVNEGALLTVAASGVLANDVAGADGFTAGGGVVGVRAAGIDLTTDVTTGIGTNIAGLHGTLVLQANGGYTYQSTADNITAATTDVFVYTVKDGDGDLSTTTLTINLADVTVTASDTDALVNEAGLPVIGSAAASNSEIFNGSITPSGGTGPYSFALTSPATGIHGTLVLNAATGTYTYTLTSPFDTTPDSATTAAQTEQDKDSFSYTVTDAQGNTATGTILVDIVDDVPTATLDSGNVNEGALLTVAASGVLANDVAGADGFTAGGGVVGVRAAGIDLTTDVTTGIGTNIAGLHGTLVLQANGGYTYQSTADNITAATTDVFVYTVKDGDGDLSTTTLTINLADVTVVAPADNDVTVNENALDTTITGSDLAAGTITGSLGTASPAETDASNQLNGSGGFGTLTYALVSGGNAPTAGLFGTIQVNTNGSYVYTLTKPFDTSPDANNGTNTEVAESFTYRVTDAAGNSATGTITVNIVDDVPLPITPDPLVGSNVAGTSATAFLDSDHNIDNNVGADQLGTVRFPASLTASGLTSGGIPIIYTVSNGGLLLTGTAGGSPVFTITLNPDGSFAGTNDAYTLSMIGIVDTESTINFDEGTHDFTGGNTAWAGFVPNGQRFGQTPVPDGSDDLLLTPAGVGTTINGNANAAGVSGGSGSGLGIGAGEAIRLDYVNDLTGDPAGSGGFDNPANRDFVFADHYEVNGAVVSFGGINAGSAEARFTAKDDPDTGGNNVVGDGTPDPVTSVAIRFGTETKVVALVSPFDNPVIVGGHSFTITQDGASVIVGGLVNGASIATYTASGFNSLEVAYVSGNPFLITGFGTASVLSAPVSFNVPVELVDADGDAASSIIGVTLNPATALTVAITDDEAGTANIASGSILYTFQFSEIVTGFDAADITVVNGTKGSFTAVDGDTYTLVVTPTAGFQGVLAVGVAAGVALDAAATPNTAALSVQVVDTLAPTVAVNIVEGSLNDGVTGSVVTFDFSEAPGASFTESDIQVSAGLTLVGGSLTMVDATHYTATVNAADGFTGNATVSLAAGNYTDAALNLGLAGSDTVTVTGGASAPPGLDLDANNSAGGGSDYTSTFSSGGPAIPIADIDVTITDPDSTTMASARISMIANGQVPPPNDTLSISGSLPGGITASAYDPTTGVLTLSGAASIADYEAALHQIVFSTTNTTSTADRIISVTVNDGATTSNLAQTFMHVVSINQTASDVIDGSQLPAANFDTQNIDGTATDVTVTATNDVIRAAVSGPDSTTVVPEWALLHNDASSVGKILDITATGSVSELTSASLVTDPGSVTIVNNDVDGGSFVYTASDGIETATATVTVQIDAVPRASSTDEILVGTPAAETIEGGSGNDILIGGGGADTPIGGGGDDVLVYAASVSSVTAGSHFDVNLLTPDNRGDVLSVSGTVDFTSLGDIFKDIETISMLAKDGSAGNSTVTLNITDVLDIAVSGIAQPGGTNFDSRDAIRIDGTAGDVVNLAPDPGTWLPATGATGVPDGYTAYSHVTAGSIASTNEDAYLFIQTGITVNGVGT